MATQRMGSVTPTISEQITTLMGTKGITSIKALAQSAGISDRSLYRKINDKPGNFTLAELADIARALDVELSVLIGEAA